MTHSRHPVNPMNPTKRTPEISVRIGRAVGYVALGFVALPVVALLLVPGLMVALLYLVGELVVIGWKGYRRRYVR